MNKNKMFEVFFIFSDCFFLDYDNVFMKVVFIMRIFKVVNLKYRIVFNSM